jgi:GT2 family glycosyltransferase
MAVPASEPREAPTVSVLICTRDRRADLARALRSLRADGVARDGVEIVVVEETARPEPIPGVRYVPLPPEGRGFAHVRNCAVQAAKGSVLVFVDDDCEVAPGWFEALLAPLADPAVAGVAGAVLVHDCNAIGYAENILGFPGGGLRYLAQADGRVVPTAFLSTCNCAYRRTAVERAGGFSSAAGLGGEDDLLAERVSGSSPCRYAPGAVVYHRPRERFGAIFRWFVRRGRAEVRIVPARVAPGNTARALLRNSMLLRLAVAGVAIAAAPVPIAVTIPLLLALYYAVVLRRYGFARRFPAHRAGWWLTPLVKVVADTGAEVGRWRELPSLLRRLYRD